MRSAKAKSQPRSRSGGRKPKAGKTGVAVVRTVPITTVSQALARCRLFRQEAATETDDNHTRLLTYRDLLRRCISDFSTYGIHCEQQDDVPGDNGIHDLIAVFNMPDGQPFCIGLTSEWAGDIDAKPTPPCVATFGRKDAGAARRQGDAPRGATEKSTNDDIPF